MSWQPSDILDVGGMYAASFGDMIDGTVYSDGMRNIQKAVNVGAASGAAGYAMTPIVYDPEVVDITRAYTPLQTMFPKRTNYGKTANYYRLTAKGAATWGVEDRALDEADDTREAASSDIKFLTVTGRVTGAAQAAGAHFKNALQEELMTKSVAMSEEIENALVNGDTATTAAEPNGLIKLLTANNTAVTGAVTLEDVNGLLDDCFVDKGHIDLMVTDAYTLTAIREQLQDFVKYADPVKVAWGMDAVAFNSNHGVVPIVASQYMPGTSTERRVIACDTRTIEQRVLVDVSYEDLAKTNDSRKFFLKTYRALISKFPEGCGQLTAISD